MATDERTSLLRDSALVFGRSMRSGVRDAPLAFVAPTLLAAFVALIFQAVFDEVAATPGFPADSFLSWVAPAAVLLSAFVGAGYAAGALLRDIESGYLDRLRLLPLHPAAPMVGRAAFEAVRIVGPASVVLVGSLALGADNRGGAGAAVAVVAITVVLAVAWNGIFFLVAVRTANPATVLGLQPLFMPVVMFSTFFAPRSSMPDWFETIVGLNPFTHLLDGTRSVLEGSTDVGALSVGIGLFVVLGAATYTMAGRIHAGLVRPS